MSFSANLPLVSTLFRRSTENEQQTTLYFFVTPHILKDENFADLAEYSYKVKLNAADKIGAERIRMVDPQFGADESNVLEGFEVPLYRSPATGEVDPEDVGWTPEKRAAALEQLEQAEEDELEPPEIPDVGEEPR